MLSFLLTCVVIEATPGPNMAYLAILSLTDGRRAGYAAMAGVALGLFLVGVAASFGLAAIIANSPMVYQVLRWSGAFYLLWLAWDGWKVDKDLLRGTQTILAQTDWVFFKRGVLTNLLNPKAYVFYITILPGFIERGQDVVRATLVLTVAYVCVASIIHLLIVTLASASKKLLNDRNHILLVRRVLSILLAVIAVWFLVTTAR